MQRIRKRPPSSDTPEALRSPCSREHEEQCWSTSGESFVAEAKLVAKVERDLAKLESVG